MERERTSCAGPDRLASTDSAVRNAAQKVLHLASAEFRIESRDGGHTAEGMVGALQPSHRALVVAQVILRESHNAGQTVKAVRFVMRQFSASTPALQTSRRKVQGRSQFF